MDKNKNDDARFPQQQENQTRGNEKHKSPFKETSSTDAEETPEEEAAAEQQRKEALTERD